MIKIFRKIQNEKGISLVELVVAVSIFSLVMIAATGIFINAMKAQKAIIAKQNVANNMRYIMEFMTKELRMARVNNTDPTLTFNDGDENDDGTFLTVKNGNFSRISFENGFGNTVLYKFDSANEKILRKEGAVAEQTVSSNEISITGLNFKINNWNLTAGSAPLITIFMTAEAKNGVGGEIDVQTSVSPRTY
ncbi:prepilin-type N-terminal cleavage/methylation domain-containing protein [Patescibacteria group bacterium]|nr:prepilin-type N-terminal cleavage/methylation domain-containing protein [Patescibacteria group bacterium]